MKLPTYHLPPSTYRCRDVSRRTFLSVVSGAVSSVLPLKTATAAVGSVVVSGREYIDCVLLDAQQHCTLPESLAGYESALRAIGVRFFKASGDSLPLARTIVIPACLGLCPEVTRHVAAALKGGGCLVLESGAGFATPTDFAAHRVWLRDCWSVRVEAPVDLWSSPGAQFGRAPIAIRHSPLAAHVPYVDFHWPFRTKVRDFSRVVPVSVLQEHLVASCGHWPVASKHTRGRGTLVFLGSPLGPALLAGDAEARRWLRAIIEKQSTFDSSTS